MTRAEAGILAEYSGAAFYIPDARTGLVGDYVCLVRRGDKPEDEGERVGPHRFYVKWDALQFRSLLNETYEKGLKGSLSGQFYTTKGGYIAFAPEGKCVHCSWGHNVLKVLKTEEAKEAAEALNFALKIGKEASSQ